MPVISLVSLVVGGVSLLLASIMLLLVLWQDSRIQTNIFCGLFTAATVSWFIGMLVGRVAAYIGGPTALIDLGVRLAEAGFTAACVTLYLFAVVLTGGQGRFFLRTALASAVVVLGYQLFISYFATGPLYQQLEDGTLLYTYGPIWSLLYGFFAVAAAFIIWQRQRKVADPLLRLGVWGYVVGVLAELIAPQLRNRSIPLIICAPSILLIAYALVRTQIIQPLTGRESQLKGFRDVGLAITSRLRLDEVLRTIATQAADMLHADGAAIYLNQGSALELAAVHNMPAQFIGQQLALGEGLAGQVALDRRVSQLEDYRRDWTGTPDMQYAREAFGAVVAVPLVFGDDVMGVLIVVENPQGKRFDREDVRLLEMLGPQAAVAIINSRLFEKQQELDRLKNQMIRMTSHDLKNPLFSAMSHIELLQEEGEDILTDEMKADIRTTWTQLQRMNRIIRGILDLERVQSGTPAYEEFSVAEMIDLAASELADQAQNQKIELKTELSSELPSIIGDRHYLVQAVVNLIENAIKFTLPGGCVRLSAEQVNDHVILHVADTGVGIPPEAQARIFERFYRAHHPGMEQVSGTGLGLSLVKAVADAHGGRIWLDSKVGQGTTFHVALPIKGPKEN